jgi:hypothetical protein
LASCARRCPQYPPRRRRVVSMLTRTLLSRARRSSGCARWRRTTGSAPRCRPGTRSRRWSSAARRCQLLRMTRRVPFAPASLGLRCFALLFAHAPACSTVACVHVRAGGRRHGDGCGATRWSRWRRRVRPGLARHLRQPHGAGGPARGRALQRHRHQERNRGTRLPAAHATDACANNSSMAVDGR